MTSTRFRRPALATLAACALPWTLALAGCGGKAAETGRPARTEVRFPVETAKVAARNVEYSVRAVGSIEAFEEVAVTARVAGVVERVRFREGDSVTAATPLAEIEPERYRLATEAARASPECRGHDKQRSFKNCTMRSEARPSPYGGVPLVIARYRSGSSSSESTAPAMGRREPASRTSPAMFTGSSASASPPTAPATASGSGTSGVKP